ncbi:MAG TPA: tetratricopeptide repeat protein [candidate division Zixibacteria bacterium]|nr:tetratricopeptide repeat protein [candidate division Zixibacteria bacterium]
MSPKYLRLIIFASLIFSPAQLFSQTNSPVQQARALMQQGKVEEARQILQKHLKEHSKDVSALLLMGKLEKEGDISLGYFKDVQRSSDVDKRAQEANLQIGYYYYVKGQYVTAIELLTTFKKQFTSSDFMPQVIWILGESYLATEQMEEAKAEFQILIENYPYTWASWGHLGLGDAYFASGEYEDAIAFYQKVLENHPGSDAVGLAYAQISSAYAELGDETKASLYINMYKEKFPVGLQSTAIFEPVTPVKKTSSKIKSGEAEKFLKVTYTVQLGVFSNREYAENLISQVKALGHKPILTDKIINDRKYYVVQTGSFSSLEAAQDLKEGLEQALNQSFRVVIK